MSEVKSWNASSGGSSTSINFRTGSIASVSVIGASLLSRGFFCCRLKCFQIAIPQLLEVLAQGLDAFRLHLVDAARSLLDVRNEPRLLEDAQMLRDGGTADGQVLGNLADGVRTAGD